MDKQAKIEALERRIANLEVRLANLGPVSLGEMMLSAVKQAPLFASKALKSTYGPYMGVYKEVGMNLIRLGHTEDEDERRIIKSDIQDGLKYLKKRDKEIKKGVEALLTMGLAFDLIESSMKRG